MRRTTQVRSLKAFQIQDEIRRISQKDHEARMLEKREDNLLKSLKDTHALQQETLSQIQDIFSSQYLNEKSLSKLKTQPILVNQSSQMMLEAVDPVQSQIIVEDSQGEQPGESI